MTTLDELTQSLTELTTNIQLIDSKLDEVKAFIDGLKAGQVITQEELDQVGATVSSAKESTAAVLAEADALDE